MSTAKSNTLRRFVQRWKDERFAKKWGNYPPKPFRTHGLAVWWYDKGCPSEIGTEVEDEMQSGRTAVFRLVNVERATGVDWSWYDFEFVRYLGTPNASGQPRLARKETT